MSRKRPTAVFDNHRGRPDHGQRGNYAMADGMRARFWHRNSIRIDGAAWPPCAEFKRLPDIAAL
jgi:prepilin-type processing-associated H-X9-DG protein